MAVENGKIASGELRDTDKVVVDSFAALSPNDFDDTPTAGSKKLMTSGAIKEALEQASEPSDYAQVKEQVQQNTQDIAGIEDKIPAQASAQNQLADKAFVNSSIATNTATFRGTYNLVSDLGLTVSATHEEVAAAIATHLAALVPPVVPENNDYCFVQVPRETSDPTVIDRIDRYKCSVTESGGVTTRVWDYEWSLNNSSFTSDQWAAINSGITAGLVEKLNGIQAGAQVNTIETVKVNGTALTPDADGAVNVQAIAPDADGYVALPTRSGHFLLVDGAYLRYDGGPDGVSYLFDPNSTDNISVVRREDLYSAIQQIAPAFTAKTYVLNELCTYNGVVYRCKWGYTATASSLKPDSDTTHWEAKKVSEVFAPLASPAFSGRPTAPNMDAQSTDGQVANKKYVDEQVAGVPLRYDMPTAVALVAANDEATLVCADRAVTNATIATGFSTLNLTFPTAVTGKVRDFYLRIVVAAGESAPALSIPQGITIENPDEAVPEIADGETSAASTTLVWFSETAPNIFTAKAETVKAVA